MRHSDSCRPSPSFVPHPYNRYIHNNKNNKIYRTSISCLDSKESHHYLKDKKRKKYKIDYLCSHFSTASALSPSSLHATNNNSANNFSTNSYHSSKKGILSRTARESAVIVEWEPVSELERRIEDGVHYEHYDPSLEYGSEEKARIRKEWKKKMSNKHDNEYRSSKQSNNKWGFNGWNGNKNIKAVDGVFCGFRVTQEEIDRLKSANPNE